MKIAVWDTYVTREDGKMMHFDILTPETLENEAKVVEFGLSYLETKSFKTKQLTTKECQFCHIEKANKEVIDSIELKGYHIIEMENCI